MINNICYEVFKIIIILIVSEDIEMYYICICNCSRNCQINFNANVLFMTEAKFRCDNCLRYQCGDELIIGHI